MSKEKFWMVLGNGSPTVRHRSKSIAVVEAERLARQVPNTEFVVLESLATVKRSDVHWEPTNAVTSDDTEVPF